MGLFDFLFGGEKKQPQQKSNQSKQNVKPFVFESPCHQRYENGLPVMGQQNCLRTVSLHKNEHGCKGYRLESGRGYIVSIWNNDLDKPNMSDKPMDLIRQTEDRWEFRGYTLDAMSPFGWMEVDYSVYGFIVFLKNGEVEKCQLHMYDRNTYIEYMKKSEEPEDHPDVSNAWNAYCSKNYSALGQYGNNVYNHFVHHPAELLKLKNPLQTGKVFQVCLGFNTPDEDIQEVRAENAYICYSQALLSDKVNIRDEAAARLMILLIRDRAHLIDKVEMACRGNNDSPLNPLSYFMGADMPHDMPTSVKTRMLYAAYYLYFMIVDKERVRKHVTPDSEVYIKVEEHVIYNCSQLTNSTNNRKIELGEIVYKKVADKIRTDIELYSSRL